MVVRRIQGRTCSAAAVALGGGCWGTVVNPVGTLRAHAGTWGRAVSSSLEDGRLTWRAVVGSWTGLVSPLGPTVPDSSSRVRRGSKPVGALRHAAMPC